MSYRLSKTILVEKETEVLPLYREIVVGRSIETIMLIVEWNWIGDHGYGVIFKGIHTRWTKWSKKKIMRYPQRYLKCYVIYVRPFFVDFVRFFLRIHLIQPVSIKTYPLNTGKIVHRNDRP